MKQRRDTLKMCLSLFLSCSKHITAQRGICFIVLLTRFGFNDAFLSNHSSIRRNFPLALKTNSMSLFSSTNCLLPSFDHSVILALGNAPFTY